MYWRNKLPREVQIHRLVDSDPTATSRQNLIRHRGYRLMMRQQRYRIYLDLCSGGNLYTALGTRFRPPRGESIHILPEGFIWHVFSSLVDACLYLQRGAPPGQQRPADWKSIFHLDIHFGNIFLDNDRENMVITLKSHNIPFLLADGRIQVATSSFVGFWIGIL